MRIVRQRPSPSELELQRKQVAALVAAVESEAHWQQILNSATPESREELERVVGPMLPFRRAAPCTTPGCDSGQHGVWQPVLVVGSPVSLEPSWVPVELRLCDQCKADAAVGDFLTDSIWDQILVNWPEPDAPPVRRLVSLQFDRVH